MQNSRPSLSDFSFRRLSPTSDLLPFDCGDSDLNDFFHNDASLYGKQLLAVTYTFEVDDKTVAFFSVLNDIIMNKDSYQKTIARKLIKLIPHKKQRRSYPAVKVGRFGVNIKYQKQGLGSDVLNFIKHFFTIGNKTGCRFITVDSYNYEKAINFYKKNGFEFLTQKDELEDTRLMYFDLIKFLT